MDSCRQIARRILALVFIAGTAAAQPTIQVLRISSGPSGADVNGAYRLDEERARFDPSTDRQVVVFFQWSGAVGPHRIAVTWRSPDASLSTGSAIDYIARGPQFGAYFNLPLTAGLPAGVWSVEATMDGQPAGRYTFELVAGEMRAATAAVRRPLETQAMFSRLKDMFVLLDRQVATGQHLDPAAAFVVSPGRIETAVIAIDAADTVTAVMPDGTRLPVDLLQGFSRRQDWAVIVSPPGASGGSAVPFAGKVAVGDRCFSMEGSGAGSRVVIDGAISGQVDGGPSGPRWIVRWGNGTGTPGAPVVTESGELIGVIGGTLVPGASGLDDLLRYRAELQGVPVIPASLIRIIPEAPPVAVADLRSRGELLPAVRGSENVLAAGFAKSIIKDGPAIRPAQERQEFNPTDKTFVAYMSWAPQARVKGMLVFRLVNEANQVVAESKPKKIDIRTNTVGLMSWEIPVPGAAGWYRGDFLLDGVPMYRRFVKIAR
jgi:hypothetical protein